MELIDVYKCLFVLLLLFLISLLVSVFILRDKDTKIVVPIATLALLLFVGVLPYGIVHVSYDEKVIVNVYELQSAGNNEYICVNEDGSELELPSNKKITIQSTYDENYVKEIITKKSWWIFYIDEKAYIINISDENT